MNSPKSVYFRMHTFDNDDDAWYAIKIDYEEKIRCQDCGSHINFPDKVEKGDGPNKEIVYKLSDPKFATLIHPFSVTEFSSNCIAVGPTIYLVGGKWHEPNNDVYCLDTRCSKNGWKRCNPMLSCRDKLFTALLDGKIYALGYNLLKPWGEVYDPRLDNWEPLPSPPFELGSGSCMHFVVLEAAKKILAILPNAKEVHLYDVITKTWQVSNEVHRFTNNAYYWHITVEVGDTYYWHSGFGGINAYDLNRQLLLSVQIDLANEGFLPELSEHWATYPNNCNHSNPCLLHLGGELFCLLWMDGRLYTDLNYGCIHCTKIRVSKVMDSEGVWYLAASVVSTQSYLVDSNQDFIDGLAL